MPSRSRLSWSWQRGDRIIVPGNGGVTLAERLEAQRKEEARKRARATRLVNRIGKVSGDGMEKSNHELITALEFCVWVRFLVTRNTLFVSFLTYLVRLAAFTDWSPLKHQVNYRFLFKPATGYGN